MWWQLWWAWASFGLVLLILEVLAPGFIFLGFGIGALIVALLFLLGLGIGLALALVIFAVCALVAWLMLRRLFSHPGRGPKIIRHDIND